MWLLHITQGAQAGNLVCCLQVRILGREASIAVLLLFLCSHTQLEAAVDDSDVHMSSLRSVCFSPEGLYLATVADDRLLRIWALELKAPVAFAPMTNGLCCTFFPHGGVIATGTRDGHVQFWTAPRVLSSLKHLCRKALRRFLTTYQVLALPIPKKMKDFLTYRTL